MKEIKVIEPVYIEQYDINVNPYLTYSQIQQIVESMKSVEGWAERNQNIDMLVLYYATEIDMDELANIGHDNLLESGMIDAVKCNVKNIDKVYEAIKYTESIECSLTKIVKELPKYFEPLDKVMKKYGNKSGK